MRQIVDENSSRLSILIRWRLTNEDLYLLSFERAIVKFHGSFCSFLTVHINEGYTALVTLFIADQSDGPRFAVRDLLVNTLFKVVFLNFKTEALEEQCVLLLGSCRTLHRSL